MRAETNGKIYLIIVIIKKVGNRVVAGAQLAKNNGKKSRKRTVSVGFKREGREKKQCYLELNGGRD